MVLTARRVHGAVTVAIGSGSAVGAFLAFGMAPLAAAPPAKADFEDIIFDPIINSLAGIDPTLGADLTSLVDSFDPSFAVDSAATAASPLDAAALRRRHRQSTMRSCTTPTSTRRSTLSIKPGSLARLVNRSTTPSIRRPGCI